MVGTTQNDYLIVGSNIEKDGDGKIIGGTFERVAESALAEGYAVVDNGNGTFGVQEASDWMGAGTEADPYVIHDEVELKLLADRVNGGNAYADSYFKLGDNITLTDTNWTPIGNGTRKSYNGKVFKGVFNGDGKTIQGLTINTNAGKDDAVGLFGVVEGGTVSNLTLTAVSITATSCQCVGAVAGFMTGGVTVEGVTVNGTINASQAGGLVGRLTYNGTIRDSVNNATVTCTSDGAGGIVSKAYCTRANEEVNIINCVNNGAVSGNSYVGGIVGLSSGNVTNCRNTADVSSTGNNTGGIVGNQKCWGTVSGCLNNGNIVGNWNFGVGGIVGWLNYQKDDSSYQVRQVVTITRNENSGSISNGGKGAGGIVGHIYNAAVVTDNINTAPSICALQFASGIVGGLQAADDNYYYPTTANAIQINGNTSTTLMENISGGCSDLYAYNNDTEFNFVKPFKIAIIGNTQYDSLAAAIAAAEDGDTVTMLADSDESATWLAEISISKAITIDGAGHTVKVGKGEQTPGKALSMTNANATIKDLTLDLTSGMFGVSMSAGTLDGVTMIGIRADKSWGVYVYGDITLKDCVFENMITAIDTEQESVGVNLEGIKRNITVDGCTFKGSDYAIIARGYESFTNNTVIDGKVNVLSGDIKAFTGNTIEAGNRVKFYAAEYTADTSKNTFKSAADIAMDSGAAVDLSGNYWGGEAPTNLPDGVTVTSYYSDAAYENLVQMGTPGYRASGAYEMLPEAPMVDGDTITVTPANAQYTLDGAYGTLSGKTVKFSAGNYSRLILGRPTKFAGSDTLYRHGSHNGEPMSYDDFIAYKSQSCYYERTIDRVTFIAEDGVTLAGVSFMAGAHVYGTDSAPIYDYVRDTGVWCTSSVNSYFLKVNISNIVFDGIRFVADSTTGDAVGTLSIATSAADSMIHGVTVRDCTFIGKGTAAVYGHAIRFYTENQTTGEKGCVRNLLIENTRIDNYHQGLYASGSTGITVMGGKISNTGHNAVAVQTKGGCYVDMGTVTISGVEFENVHDRVIRIGCLGSDSEIRIVDNSAINSGDSDGDLVKDGGCQPGVAYTISGNTLDGGDWPTGSVKINTDASTGCALQSIGENSWVTIIPVAQIGDTPYATLKEALLVAQEASREGIATTIELLKDTSEQWTTSTFTELNKVTINGNNHTLTFTTGDYTTANPEHGNGRAMWRDTGVTAINDLTIDLKPNDRNQDSYGMYLQSGTLTNVTFKNGVQAIVAQTPAGTAAGEGITLVNCVFEGQSGTVTVETNNGRAGSGLVAIGCTFPENGPPLGDNAKLENCTVGRKAHVFGNNVTVVGNTFARLDGDTLEIHAVPKVFEKNKILNGIEFADGLTGVDLSGNYWGGEAPTGLPKGVTVTSYYSDAEMQNLVDLTPPPLPTATVENITDSCVVDYDNFIWLSEKWPEEELLTFAMRFEADEPTQAQLEAYGNWRADFVLTSNTDIRGIDGFLAGYYAYYGFWGGLAANTDESVVQADVPFPVMFMPINYQTVVDEINIFDCGLYLTPEFLAAHPDFNVRLELRIYDPELDGTDGYEGVLIKSMNGADCSFPFDMGDVFVAKNRETGALYKNVWEAEAEPGETIELLLNEYDVKLLNSGDVATFKPGVTYVGRTDADGKPLTVFNTELASNGRYILGDGAKVRNIAFAIKSVGDCGDNKVFAGYNAFTMDNCAVTLAETVTTWCYVFDLNESVKSMNITNCSFIDNTTTSQPTWVVGFNYATRYTTTAKFTFAGNTVTGRWSEGVIDLLAGSYEVKDNDVEITGNASTVFGIAVTPNAEKGTAYNSAVSGNTVDYTAEKTVFLRYIPIDGANQSTTPTLVDLWDSIKPDITGGNTVTRGGAEVPRTDLYNVCKWRAHKSRAKIRSITAPFGADVPYKKTTQRATGFVPYASGLLFIFPASGAGAAAAQ